MKPLQAVDEHRPVRVVSNILTDFNDTIWPDPDQILVEGRVVESAQRDAILNSWLAQRMGVWHDVRRFEQLVSLESTDGAVVQIGADHALPKRCLV